MIKTGATPVFGAFARAYSRWLAKHPKLETIGSTANSSKTIRYWLHMCLTDEIEIVT